MTKTNIFVLGGGISSLSAIYTITNDPDWNDRFNIVLIQIGHRLGGKCASSRNIAHRYRNEEHGLHILGGFYHNTFAIIRNCYDEWKSHFPHALDFDQTFVPHPNFILTEKVDSTNRFFHMPYPENEKEPGIDPTELTPLEMLKVLMKMAADSIGFIVPEDLIIIPEGAAPVLFIDYFRDFSNEILEIEPEGIDDKRSVDLQSAASLMASKIGRQAPTNDDWEHLQALILIELVLVLTKGMFADKIIFFGFDVANDKDAQEWLRHHGGSERLAESIFINSGYEYAFSYADGDPAKKSFAAGAAIRGFLRLITTSHGAVFYHMNGGMGETVITPLYEVLKKRGVKFRFFHNITELGVSDDGSSIDRISGVVQARPVAGRDGYDPLINWQGRKAWPAEPRFCELENGDAHEHSLKDFESFWENWDRSERFDFLVDKDFDVVLCGIPIAALKHISVDLEKKDKNWADMLSAIKTAPTIGVQYWLKSSTKDLGWDTSIESQPLLTGFDLPLSTWCDMSFLLPFEDATGTPPYENLSYLCGPMPRNSRVPHPPSPKFPESENVRFDQMRSEWNKQFIEQLIPLSGDKATGKFHSSESVETFISANVNPSDEYVISVAGSVDARLKTDEATPLNLYLCGDWIKSGWDVGAVEGAVTSGMQASRAISGMPHRIVGETDFP